MPAASETRILTAIPQQIHTWTLPVVLIVGGVVCAYVLQRLINRRLSHWAETAQWTGAHIIVAAVRGMVFLWLSVVGVIVAMHNGAELSSANQGLFEHAIKVLLVISATMVAARIIAGFLRLYLSHLSGVASSSIFANVSTVMVYLMGLLVVLQTMEIPITPVLGFLGVGGLAVALAAQDTLANLFAGIHILIARHVRPGDYVRIDGDNEGFVTDVGWRNTSFRSLSNNLVVVPNAKLASTIVTNYSLPEKYMLIKITLGVSYDSDLTQVERVALEVAQQVVSDDLRTAVTSPSVHFHTFADSSINFDISIPVNDFQNQSTTRHRFIMLLHARFRDEGIDIPYPVRTVHLHGAAMPPAAVAPPGTAS